MGHHGEELNSEQRRHIEKLIAGIKSEDRLGPTGNFPMGSIHPTDKGELKMGVAHKDGKVIVHFGAPTEWIGLDKKQAIDLAKIIVEHAIQILTP